MIDVSVIMPAYNAGPFVASAVESVLGQANVAFELLVCDDASTDDTWSVLEPYRDHPRVRLSRNESNRGSSATRNRLIHAARGRYVTPCDADDLLLSLSPQMTFLDQHPDVGTVYGNILGVWLDDAGRIAAPPEIIGRDCNRTWDLLENVVNHGGSMSRRALLDQAGGYDERVAAADDWSLWLKMAEIARIHFLEGELLYIWRRHRGSLIAHPGRAHDTELIIHEAAQRRIAAKG